MTYPGRDGDVDRLSDDEARRAFRMSQRLDPECALCYWGEAWVPRALADMQGSEEYLEQVRARLKG